LQAAIADDARDGSRLDAAIAAAVKKQVSG
jgi:hypothetical protein